ncbi:TauD/TfdA family dioxygenase [Candidatus Pelagibacter ubique]|nr:TauD/TfdA family dioxygenase [Candidatus Pelagibacter ubique]
MINSNKNFFKVINLNLKNIKINDAILIKKNLNKHGVVLFKNQKLNPKNLKKIAEALGKPIIHNFSKTLKDYPEIMRLEKNQKSKKMFGGMWHTDSTYLKKPPKYTMLYPIKLPTKGLGGTQFTCQILAYDNLKPQIKKKIRNLYSCNSSYSKLASYRGDAKKKNNDEILAYHKLVKKLPGNIKTLYFSPGHIKFLSLSKKIEKRPKNEKKIIKTLLNTSISKKNIAVHYWEKNDFIIWNNERTLHCPLNNFKNQKRIMLRLSVI